MRAGLAVSVLGAALMSTASTAQADPGDPTAGAATLVVHTTVITAAPRRGSAAKAQVWVSAAGGTAENATLSFSAEPPAGVRVAPVCTLTAQGYCKLGDVDATGATVPFTVEVPEGATSLTLTLGIFTRADGVPSSGERTKITFRPTVRKTPTPKATPKTTTPRATPSATASPQATPRPSPTVTPLPSATVPLQVPTVVPSSSASPTLGLPTLSPTDGTGLPGYTFTAQPQTTLPGPETELAGEEVPHALALAQSLWLGVLLAACSLAAALAFRRGARIRRRPEDPDAAGKHRPKGA